MKTQKTLKTKVALFIFALAVAGSFITFGAPAADVFAGGGCVPVTCGGG